MKTVQLWLQFLLWKKSLQLSNLIQTVLLNFRAQPEDAADLRSEAERQRTTVSSLVRGALVQVGLLKNHPKEGNTEQEVNHGL